MSRSSRAWLEYLARFVRRSDVENHQRLERREPEAAIPGVVVGHLVPTPPARPAAHSDAFRTRWTAPEIRTRGRSDARPISRILGSKLALGGSVG
jgi:hypothetical protein